MLDFLTDSVENALDVIDGFLTGDPVSKRQVAKMIADGVSVATVAAMAGVTVDVIEELLKD